jgi:hypothetical protein
MVKVIVYESLHAFSSGEIPLTPDVESTTVLFPETNPEIVTKMVSVEFTAFNWFELYETLVGAPFPTCHVKVPEVIGDVPKF